MPKYKHAKKNKYGSILLPNGKKITVSEQKEYKNLVRRANYQRSKMIQNIPNEQRAIGYLFGSDTNFVYSKKSYSLSRFRNRSEFNEAVKQLKRYTNKNYMHNLTANYKTNYLRELKRAYGEEAKDIYNKIRNMPLDEFQRMVQSDELESLGYVYKDPDDSKLQLLREELGIKQEEVLKATVKKAVKKVAKKKTPTKR